MTDPTPPHKRSPMEHERDDLTPEAVERIKAEVMTLETLDGLWVTAEDYAALSAERDALRAEVARLREVAQNLLDAIDKGRMVPAPGSGVGGQTIESNLRGSVYHGVPVWPFEEARIALTKETDQ